MRPVLLFDGDCGFCMRTLGWLRLLDRGSRIDTLPYQRPGAPESIGASFDECAGALQWRGADGTRLAGAAAINAALGVALGARWPETLYRRSATVQNRGYGWVVRNRYRLPGVQPWCARYPDDCRPTTALPDGR
ncbi:MAG: thiol-disulfide oxidoreductase DCC family protein [Pseudonocardia sp.]|jgi:predicted DCC family thiol-disulfide oxidoreductase YuxK